MSTRGYIINGKYTKAEPNQLLIEDVNSTYKQWRQDDQRAKHKADILQPYDRNGKLSEEFKMVYPEESKMYEQ